MTTKLPEAGSPGDGPLVLAARDGDRQAFGHLVARHEGWMRNMMAARLTRWQDAEDAAQEAFAKAFAALGALKEPEAFRGWLRTIGERVASDLKADGRPLPRLPGKDSLPDAGEVEARERRRAVASAVEALEEPYREVVVLRYDRGLSCAAIAGMLGISVSAVTMRLTRAHRALEKDLAPWRESP